MRSYPELMNEGAFIYERNSKEASQCLELSVDKRPVHLGWLQCTSALVHCIHLEANRLKGERRLMTRDFLFAGMGEPTTSNGTYSPRHTICVWTQYVRTVV